MRLQLLHSSSLTEPFDRISPESLVNPLSVIQECLSLVYLPYRLPSVIVSLLV